VEALLIDEWLRAVTVEPITIRDEASAAVVRDRVRAIAAPKDVVERAALIGTEMVQNHLRHAVSGLVAVVAAARGEHLGIELVAIDRGPGIPDVATALDAVPGPVGSLGVGLGSIVRLATDVDFDVRLGEGTRIVARVFADGAPKEREIGVYGTPHPGEIVSGDHASYRRVGETIVVTVCDGLGHVRPARDAASAAIEVFDRTAAPAPEEVLRDVHGALGSTRGAVMAVGRLRADHLSFGGVGNIEGRIVGPRRLVRLGGTSGVLGFPTRGPKTALRFAAEDRVLEPGDVLVLTTDGIGSRMSIENDLALLRMHPVVIAQTVLETFGRDNDDALALVVR